MVVVVVLRRKGEPGKRGCGACGVKEGNQKESQTESMKRENVVGLSARPASQLEVRCSFDGLEIDLLRTSRSSHTRSAWHLA